MRLGVEVSRLVTWWRGGGSKGGVEGRTKAWLNAGYDLVPVWLGNIASVFDIISISIGK